jgi:hypothetical protein
MMLLLFYCLPDELYQQAGAPAKRAAQDHMKELFAT